MYDKYSPKQPYRKYSSGPYRPFYGQVYIGPADAPPPRVRTNGLAVASLVLGLLWICGLGSLFAVLLGHIALSDIRRTRAKGVGVATAGLVLGYLGLVGALFFLFVSVRAPESPGEETATVVSEATGTPGKERAGAAEEKKEEATPAPSPTRSAFNAGSYRRLSSRGFAKLAKDPDAYAGKRFVIYGRVFQFDSVTGNDAFLARIGHAKPQSSYYADFDQGAAFTGKRSQLSNVVKDDLFQSYVTVLGSFGYNTQIGGNTTVPSFRVDRVKVYDHAD